MKRRWWAVRSLQIGVGLLVSGCGVDEPISIGVVGAFSQSEGAGVLWSAESAVNAINATGGIDGRPLRLVAEDDSAQPERARLLARQFYDDPSVVAVIGHTTTPEAMAAAPIYSSGPSPIVAITPSASVDDLPNTGPFIFQICPSDSDHGSALAAWTYNRLQAREAAILYQNDDYGRRLRNAYAISFETAGGAVVADYPYLAELPSFDPFLRVLRRRGGADVLLIAGTHDVVRRVVPTLDSVNLRTRVIGADRLTDLRRSPALFAGVLISSAYLPDRPTPRNRAFVEDFSADHNTELPDHVAAGTFDAVHLLARSIAEVGTDRRAIRDYLATIGRGTAPFEGITGTIRFDDRGALQDREVKIGIITGAGLASAEPN